MIRTPVHVGIHKDSRHILGSFQSLLQDHPQARVRWATASGRTGTLTAKELARSPIQLRGQTLVLQAILPDGRTWQGTQVMP